MSTWSLKNFGDPREEERECFQLAISQAQSCRLNMGSLQQEAIIIPAEDICGL